MTILHLDSSILGDASVSRVLSAELVAAMQARAPGAQVITHDLVADPVPPLTGAHLAALHGAEVTDPALAADLARGAAFIDELFAAEAIVIGAPMYNFGIASQLKNWIDRVIVAGRTFRYGANGPEGLLPTGKTLYLVSSRGGVYSDGSPAAALEHHETYLRAVLGFIGLTNVVVIRAEGVAMGDEGRAAAFEAARRDIAAAVG
ncbi:ACP phosphodiesterase [Ameyamaea chiangmaiensis NBRC 103196]|uniref:FMN dependent NADH:quinone oxidoreductase n=1 Tax=Ameyamaea chiangmaiensis TaxID=442969 RepID=A0A850P5Q2_9PROT|nr:NAD(P)H-dependent oxidoreductase [Ameyamaea chiangmaiensis]MBS4074146.1 NAD(P)H-dependent oxidoreductase [Ameyamaea chiangmaiensis]NVN39957.1 NAD(P)H-dependent oxidoreductase [Ameyamaea chiangmaiensis]GBQ71033.1 ACP phosphodiesterase [Ameyamaea chiangmaiensis NBRC 103196]